MVAEENNAKLQAVEMVLSVLVNVVSAMVAAVAVVLMLVINHLKVLHTVVFHGGEKRCRSSGCTKSAKGRTMYCIGHGGGRHCKTEGCDKSALSSSEFCFNYGSIRRCSIETCTKAAQGSTQLCSGHGGGYRCQGDACIFYIVRGELGELNYSSEVQQDTNKTNDSADKNEYI
jgi:hypothetical protein